MTIYLARAVDPYAKGERVKTLPSFPVAATPPIIWTGDTRGCWRVLKHTALPALPIS